MSWVVKSFISCCLWNVLWYSCYHMIKCLVLKCHIIKCLIQCINKSCCEMWFNKIPCKFRDMTFHNIHFQHFFIWLDISWHVFDKTIHYISWYDIPRHFVTWNFMECCYKSHKIWRTLSWSHVIKCHTNGMKCHVMFGAIMDRTWTDTFKTFYWTKFRKILTSTIGPNTAPIIKLAVLTVSSL